MNSMDVICKQLNLFRPDLAKVREAAMRSDHQSVESQLLERWRNILERKKDIGDGIRDSEWQAADLLLEDKLSLLNSPLFELGDPIDWTQFADTHPQMTCHLGYMRWLDHLAKAYAYSCEEKYAEKLLTCMESFLDGLPYGSEKLDWYPAHVAWEDTLATSNNGESSNVSGQWHSLSCHARIDNWLRALACIAHSPSLTFQRLWRILDSLIHEHAQLIVDNPRENTPNQYLANSTSLIRLGIMFPEFRVAQSYFEIGWNRFQNALRTSVLPDGSCIERSLNYNQHLPRAILQIVDLLQGTAKQYSEYLQAWGYSISLVLARLTNPDGRNLQVAKTHPDKITSLAKSWGEAFDIRECLRIAGAELPCPNIQPSFYLPYGGYCILQSDWSEQASQVFFKNSGMSPGHMHEDCLNLTLYQHGEQVLIEAGNFNYNKESQLDRSMADYCCGTHGHNLITVDGQGQCREGLRFQRMGRNMHQVPNWEVYRSRLAHRVAIGENYAFAEGLYEDGFGSADEPQQISHYRMVVWVNDFGLVVIDKLTPSDSHSHCYRQFWHLAASFKQEHVKFDKGRGLLEARSARLQLQISTAAIVEYELAHGQDHPSQGWHCYEYEQRQPSVDVSFRVESSGPQYFITLIRTHKEFDQPAMCTTECQDAAQLNQVTFHDSLGNKIRVEKHSEEWVLTNTKSNQEASILRIPDKASQLPSEVNRGVSRVLQSLAVDKNPKLTEYFKINQLKT